MSQRIAKRVLLLGWDAADWKVIDPLLDAGKMPFLEELINGGVMGNLATLRPILSPMLWNSIATGKRAGKHGILGFVESHPDGEANRVNRFLGNPLWLEEVGKVVDRMLCRQRQ